MQVPCAALLTGGTAVDGIWARLLSVFADRLFKGAVFGWSPPVILYPMQMFASTAQIGCGEGLNVPTGAQRPRIAKLQTLAA
jgi:hypothetical protein